MNYRYDNDNESYVSGHDGTPESEPDSVDAKVIETPSYITPGDNGETSVPSYIEPAAELEPVAAEPEIHVEYDRQSEDWREASFYEVPSSQEPVFTPGLGNVQFYAPPRKESTKREPTEHGFPHRARRGGRFVRALCLVIICAVISAAAGVGSVYYVISNGYITVPATQVVLGATPSPSVTPVIDTGDAMEIATPTEGKLSGPEVYGMATQQVVGISTEIKSSDSYNPFYSGGTSSVYGTGFIISEDGYILTNYHVVESAYRGSINPQVILRDGTTYSARIVGFEATNDVAVIKIDATGLTPAKIGTSGGVRVGESIYAVGNPNQLDYTITEGIVSALDREVQVDTSGSAITMFQISAAVNSGNSGGPVYNERGEVIGIVSAKYMSTGTEGLGFAIPIDDAMDIAIDLITVGYVTGKAQLGVSVQTMSEANAEYFRTVPGAFVFSVVPDSCAWTAGVRPGDIITRLNDAKIMTPDDLKAALSEYKAGDTVSLEVYRDGQSRVISITFDEQRTVSNGTQSVDVPSVG